MKKYLLDTSIVAFLFRGKYNISDHLSKLDASQCFVSDVTIAELVYGAYHSDYVQKNLDMIENFRQYVTVIPFAEAINEYGKQKEALVSAGQMIEDFDLLIGCTAVARDMIMVTDNIKHFSRIQGIVLENWVQR